MILSPDKISMPRYNPTTNEGRITGEIYQQLNKGGRDAMGQLACRLDREKEVRLTDLINELVIHELQKAVLHGRHVNIDEGLVRQAVMDMIPEGSNEGDRFYEVINDFKTALNAGNYDLVNAIYEDPSHYGRALPGRLQSMGLRVRELFQSKAVPRYNYRLQNYLRAIVERRTADLLGPDPRNPAAGPSPANVTRFVEMFDGISQIMHGLTLENLPIDPAVIQGNANLQTQIHALLTAQMSRVPPERPKVYEALRMGLVPPDSIDPAVDRVAREFAARRGSEYMGHQTASFEQQAKVLSQAGTPTGSYDRLVVQPEALDPEKQRLLLLLDDSPKTKQRFPDEDEDDWIERMRRYHRLPDRLKNIEQFVEKVQMEVFEPFAALTSADRVALTAAKTAREGAQKNLEKARTSHNAADIARYQTEIDTHQATIDRIFERVARMQWLPFHDLFLRRDVRPLLYQYLCHSLLEGIDSYKTMRAELLKIRTMPNTSHVYQLLDLRGFHDSTFRNMHLVPIIRARLRRSAVPAMERQALIDAEVTTDHELAGWGL